jgi:parallel beta-helix repeat protein
MWSIRSLRPLEAALAALVTLVSPALAGDLTPPAGPVIQTMKTLDDVEARIPIGPMTTPGDASSVFRITQAGSYYLTGNVLADGSKSGIVITTRGVTLDLNGYSLLGAGSAGGFGVQLFAPSTVAIRNGMILDWAGGAIEGPDTGSVLLEDLICAGGVRIEHHSQVRRVKVTNGPVMIGDGAIIESCRVTAGHIEAGLDANITQTSVRSAAGAGIQTEDRAIIERCMVYIAADGFRLGASSIVRDSTARQTTEQGFDVGPGSGLLNCRATSTFNGFLHRDDGLPDPAAVTVYENCISEDATDSGFYGFSGGVYRGCTSTNSGVYGFQLLRSAIFERCIAAGATNGGFFVDGDGVFTDCTARQMPAGEGFRTQYSMTARGCLAQNAFTGYLAGAYDGASSVLESCIARENANTGFYLYVASGSRIVGCTAEGNGHVGISLGNDSMAIDCIATGNAGGGMVIGTRSLVRGCNASFNQSATSNVDGIRVVGNFSRIEANTCIQNDAAGIAVPGDRNVVAANNVAFNNGNISITGASNQSSNSGSTATAGPWQNITH